MRPGQPFLVVVDYAHTPDALERVLATARADRRRGRLAWCSAAAAIATAPSARSWAGSRRGSPTWSWLTSDNPRSEARRRSSTRSSPACARAGGPRCTCELDRAARDRRRARLGRPGRPFVIAGKGHETYQIVGDRTLPFDDREVARAFLAGRSHA